ncbi:MAG: peptidase M4 [Gammaproteobacteria bacterium]|nr:peptidase M4 [Gammaproteobacteria bacterium]
MKMKLLFLVMVVGMTDGLELYADSKDDLSKHVLKWVKEGKVLSYDAIKKRYKKRLKGKLLDLEVEKEKGRIIYELELLREDSVVYEIKIDAQTGEWLKEEKEH